jgi:hypothetical protein
MSYVFTFFVGQADAAAPAPQRRLNRPWLNQKLCPVGTPVRARRILRRNPQELKSGIRVVGIGRAQKRGQGPKWFRRILRQPGLALLDPYAS